MGISNLEIILIVVSLVAVVLYILIYMARVIEHRHIIENFCDSGKNQTVSNPFGSYKIIHNVNYPLNYITYHVFDVLVFPIEDSGFSVPPVDVIDVEVKE